jgi:molecular chaperone GrpE (heat shock protein)
MGKDKKKCEEKNENKPDQLQETTELLQRTQANFENFRKQTEKRMEEIRDMTSRGVILQILPVLDNFELALKSTDQKGDFVSGVELIYAQLFTVLENNDIKIIETEDRMFDPHYHEALMKVESDLPENTIIEELQKGYLLHDKVVRHARVKISAGKKE